VITLQHAEGAEMTSNEVNDERRRAHRARRPRVWVWPLPVFIATAAVYIALRVLAVVGTGAASNFPDSETYRHASGFPKYRFIDFAGHAVRPWTVPLFYRLLPSDNLRVDAQVLVSVVAWLTLAGTVALVLRDDRVRIAAFVIVLALSCTTAVASWDRTILAESLAISTAVFAFAAALRFVVKATWWNAAAFVSAMTFFTFTKVTMFPVIALAAVFVGLMALAKDARLLRIVTALVLVALAAWGAVTTSRVEKAYAVVDNSGASGFALDFVYELRLNILNDSDELAWFVAHGMPDPIGLVAYARTSPSDDGWPTWSAFVDSYRARPDLASWVEDKGRGVYARYVLTHPWRTASHFAHDLPYMLAPPKSAIVYDNDPRQVLPSFAESMLFDAAPAPTSATYGDVGLLAAVSIALVLIARRRGIDRSLLLLAGALFVFAAVGIAIGWVVVPIEIGRHAIPQSVLIRLALWIAVFVSVDALLSAHPDSRTPNPRRPIESSD
jgi:hypothetical protein